MKKLKNNTYFAFQGLTINDYLMTAKRMTINDNTNKSLNSLCCFKFSVIRG